MKPKVSVIIPSLNVGKYIAECLDSVINQTMKDIEIICVDAGSTDGTLETIKEYAQNDKRIKVLNSDMKSYGRQMNMGLEIAKGEYVAFLDSDDFIREKMFDTLYKAGIKNPKRKMDVVTADYSVFHDAEKEQRVYERRRAMPDYPFWKEFDPRFDMNLYLYPPAYWKSLFRRVFLKNNKINFNESKGAAFQDSGFFIQVYSCAQKVYYVDDTFYMYRLGREGQSVASPKTLSFVRQEYSRLLENKEISKKLVYLDGVMCRMANTFPWAYDKALLAANYNEEELADDFDWIKNKILEKSEFLSVYQKNYPSAYNLLSKLLYNKEAYVAERKIKYAEKNNAEIIPKSVNSGDIFSKNQIILDSVQAIVANTETAFSIENRCLVKSYKNIIVYGYGVLGKVVVRELRDSRVKVVAVMDSTPEKVTGIPDEMPLLSPNDKMPEYDAIIVTAVAAFDAIKKNLTAKRYKNIINILELV